MRTVRLRYPYHRRKIVKKKIRAIQFGVGPIGASTARLMREKQAIEICGAIDSDPAKAGRDLGEVIGASDAPWGVKISADAREVLEQNADVVIHTTSSSLPKVMDQLLACLEAESSRRLHVRRAFLSLSHLSRAFGQARRGRQRVWRRACRHRSESWLS